MKYRLENTHLFVAEEEGEVIGFANFSPIRLQNEAELGAIYLLPDQQGKGIGKPYYKEGSTLKGIRKLYIHVEVGK